ncbi:hypothetical protein [Brenneria sp. g21c3]|uniref:hypothetical protein n=1 Tax=Brenneria sp. g21c3 TaxID=3093893 RepID=UPI002ED27BCD
MQVKHTFHARRSLHPMTLAERLEAHIERERGNMAGLQRDSMPQELERTVRLNSHGGGYSA